MSLPVSVLAAPAAGAAPLAVTPAQAQTLGILTQPLQRAAESGVAGLPGTVVVPTGQLRVIAAPVAAVVEQVLVAAGDTVRAGQPLLRLQSPQLLEWQRDARQAASQAALTAQQLARDESLFKEGIIAEARVQGSRAQHAQAAALLAERREQLRLAGAGTGSGEGSVALLRAPIDGVVLEQTANVGQRVEAATPLLRVGKLKPLWVEIQAPAALAAQVTVGATVRLNNSAATGKLIQIGRQLSGGQTLTLRARIDQGADSLQPGQQVEASLLGALQAAGAAPLWRVPGAAVTREGKAAQVFVVVPGGFAARAVQVAGSVGSDALVSGELREGEAVVVKGVAALKGLQLQGSTPPAKD